MCGICGIVGLGGGDIDVAAVDTMKCRLRHRGPDDEGSFQAAGCALGFVRLSIVDLSSAGHQPMSTPNGRFTIVYNGEVFNYLEIRSELAGRGVRFASRTDTEVVLAAYAEWGIECLERFNGMFAFAIYDALEKKLVLVRDRFGVKPLYYAVVGDRLLFASEIKAITAVLPPELVAADDQLVFDYLAFERVDHTEGTFFRGIRKLAPGHCLTVRRGSTDLHRWYSLSERIGRPFAGPDEYRATFASSLRYALRGDVPVGVSLSGGIDSSSIAGTLLHVLGHREFPTFSAVYGAGARGDESAYARSFAPWIRQMHEVEPNAETLRADLPAFVRAQGEPVPRTGPYAQFKVMELAGRHVKVTLEGQGADEALAGYHNLFGFYYRRLFLGFRWGTLAREYWATRRAGAPMTGFSSALVYMAPSGYAAKRSIAARRHLSPEFAAAFLESSSVPRLFFRAPDLRGALVNMVEHKLEHLLKWTDHNSMRFSVESRVPFLDHELVERTLALPARDVVRDGTSKFILRSAMRGIVPDIILARRDKVGFGTPEDEWLRAPAFRELVRDVLGSAYFRSQPYVRVEDARRLYERHLERRTNAARHVWKWINLYLWHHECVTSRRQDTRDARPKVAAHA